MAQSNASPTISRSSETSPIRRHEGNLSRWSPWDDLAEMHRQMDDFFSRSFGYTPLSRLIPFEGREMADVDIYEKPDAVIVEAAVPGFTAEEIHVDASPESVQIEGERKTQQIDEKTRQHRHSNWSSQSRFRAVLPLPCEINPAQVKAKLEHGVLKLELPKSEQARQKSVRVNVQDH